MKSGSRSKQLHIVEGVQLKRLRLWSDLLRTVSKAQRRVASTVTDHGLTLPQFDVLATLRFGDRLTQQELADRLIVTKGNICGVLDRLEDLGWVERQSDPADARTNRVVLTPGGRAKIDAVLPIHDIAVEEILGGLTGSDVSALRALIEKVRTGD